MGLFGKQDAETTDAVVSTATPKRVVRTPEPYDVASVIVKPRITEKAAILIDKNVYAFEVKKDATKHQVRDAVKELYHVTPIRVRMVVKQPRHSMSRMRGRDILESGMKKAYVYLKEGDRIDLI